MSRPQGGATKSAATTTSSSSDISTLADAGIDQLRSVAKWMIGAFAAIASLMLAGIQLTSLGKATDGKLGLAVGAIMVAVGGAMFAIYQLSKVLQPVIVGPDDATSRADNAQDAFGKFVTAHKGALLPQDVANGAALWAAYNDARTKVTDLESSGGADEAIEAAKAELRQRSGQLARLVWFATFVDVNTEFKTARWRVCVVAVVVAAAIALFAWAANPPAKQDSQSEVVVTSQPVAVRVLLNHTGRRHFASLLGAECANAAATPAGVAGIAILATATSTTVVLVPGGNCAKPVELSVPITDGSVIAAEPVKPATPTATPTPTK